MMQNINSLKEIIKMTSYDQNNVFAKIIRKEIPCKNFYEDEHILAFHDIAPIAPTHILVIPKGEYIDFSDFVEKAGPERVANYFTKIQEIIGKLGLSSYRIMSNAGANSGQTVFHFHTHVISGKKFSDIIE